MKDRLRLALLELGFDIKEYSRVLQGSSFVQDFGFTVFVSIEEKYLTLTYSLHHLNRSLLYMQNFNDEADAIELIQNNWVFNYHHRNNKAVDHKQILPLQ